MPEAFRHVRELADRIGPRPATTDAEAEAADYIEDAFRARGLQVDRDEFECPRTYSWAYVAYHLLTIASVVAVYFADVWGPLRWVAFVVAALTAFLLWMDLDTRRGLSAVVGPKGPSQNIVARRVPKARRGERTRKIVIVAHYDSARSSLAFAPAMVKNFGLSFGLMKWCTFLVPLLILAENLPLFSFADPYVLWATIVLAAYLLVPLLINVHRELFMHFTDGANDNASGVAAMLGVMEALVPESEGGVSMATQPLGRTVTGSFAPLADPYAAEAPASPRPPADARGADGDDLLAYSPAEVPEETYTELPDDFEWADTPSRDVQGQGAFEFESAEDHPPPSTPAVTGSWGDVDTDFDGDGIPDIRESEESSHDDEELRRELFGTDGGTASVGPPPRPARSDEEAVPPARSSGTRGEAEKPRRKGFFGGLGRKKERRDADVSSWLGVDGSFDAREEGRKMGSWDGFDEDDEGFGFKGGWAGDDPIGDPDFAANEAHRIRRRITEHVDRSLAEKEVWFVATGAEEVGTCGMKAFLRDHAEELRGALIINLDNIGAGTLHWVTREGMVRRYASDRRLVSAARQVSREEEVLVKGREYRGLSTDATPALARGHRAMSIMAFDINGRLPHWHWHTDTADNVQTENVENAVRLVTGMIRVL